MPGFVWILSAVPECIESIHTHTFTFIYIDADWTKLIEQQILFLKYYTFQLQIVRAYVYEPELYVNTWINIIICIPCQSHFYLCLISYYLLLVLSLHLCSFVCVYFCYFVCVCIFVSLFLCIFLSLFVSLFVCIIVFLYLCLFVSFVL